MKTHLTKRLGGRRKFSIYSVLQEISQNVSFSVSGTVSSFFIMKICYQIKQFPKQRLNLMYSF